MTSLRSASLAVLIFALFLPGLGALLYFVIGDEQIARILYSVSKSIQFLLPAIWCFFVLKEKVAFEKLTTAKLLSGLKTGLVFFSLTLVAYFFIFRKYDLLAGSGEAILQKIKEFGVSSPASFVVLAIYISVLHSFLEEYYWRWFVFRKLREFTSFRAALAISSVGFTLHHIVVISIYSPKNFSFLLIPVASLAVAFAGGVWAYQYEKTRSLWAVWISHLLTDSALMVVGYQLISWHRIGT